MCMCVWGGGGGGYYRVHGSKSGEEMAFLPTEVGVIATCTYTNFIHFLGGALLANGDPISI